ncbi:hypothetical protein ACQY0O_005287 [Thecaphora frezii]
MAEIVKEYLSTPSSSRLDSPGLVHGWLTALESQALVALGSLSDSLRTRFSRALVADLGRATGSRQAAIPINLRSPSKWPPELRLLSLKLLKELSRLPGGSSPLAERAGLESLLLQIDFPPPRRRRSRKSASSDASLSASLSSSPSFAGTLSRALRRPKTASNGSRSSEGSGRRSRTSRTGKDAADSDESSVPEEELAVAASSGVGAEADWLVTDMALRCLNNALFLNESSRLEFSGDEVGGGRVAVALLANPQDTPVDILFLGSRLLFFSTLFDSPFNRTAVETLGVVRKEAGCTLTLLRAILEDASNEPRSGKQSILAASATATQLGTALSDLLKAHFNICLYYPRLATTKPLYEEASHSTGQSNSHNGRSNGNGNGNIEFNANGSNSSNNGTTNDGPSKSNGDGARKQSAVAGESYHEALDDMLEPILEVVVSLPISEPAPLVPPMTHAIAALLNYPLEEYRERWANHTLDPVTASNSGADSDTEGCGHSPTGSPTGSAARKLADSVSALFSSSSSGPLSRRDSKTTFAASAGEGSRASTTTTLRPHQGLLRFTSEISKASTAALEAAPPVVSKLLVLTDRVLERYLSAASADSCSGSGGASSGEVVSAPNADSYSVEDPDSKLVRDAANRDGVELEDALPPLLLLLRKLASDDAEFRRTMRSILLPADLDRTRPIDKRLDLVGRLTRLMSSLMLTRSARAAGEILLAVCNGEAQSMTEAIGYGPCAGFLMNSGLASALPSHHARASTSQGEAGEGRSINPITGQFDPTEAELAADFDDMTEEEKEAEAEKLFVLFERLNRTGVVKVQDPRETMVQQGRFEEVTEKREDEEQRRREEQEARDEEEVEREMKMRKERLAEAKRRARRLAGLKDQEE